MKKTIFTICALLAAGSACFAGCANEQPNDTNPNDNEPTRITVEENAEGSEKKCPDGENCPKDGCPKDDMHKGHMHKRGSEHVKPNFRFEPPAESELKEDGTKNDVKEKAPENTKGSFGKKHRFDKRFKDNIPEEKDTPVPEIENKDAHKDEEKTDK